MTQIQVHCKACRAVICSADLLQLEANVTKLAMDAVPTLKLGAHPDPFKRKMGMGKALCVACGADVSSNQFIPAATTQVFTHRLTETPIVWNRLVRQKPTVKVENVRCLKPVRSRKSKSCRMVWSFLLPSSRSCKVGGEASRRKVTRMTGVKLK